MKFVKSLAVVLVAAVALPASAAVVESKFVTGADGWRASNGSTKIEHSVFGGPGGGGYLKVYDMGEGRASITAPSSFLTALRALDDSNGGSLSFDYKVDSYGANVKYGFDIGLELWIDKSVAKSLGINNVLYLPVDTVNPSDPDWVTWRTFTVSLVGSEWGVSNEIVWKCILSAVTEMRFVLEAVKNEPAVSGKRDIVGIGNIAFMPKPEVEGPGPDVPEPATLALLSVGALAMWRRRNSR